LFATARSDICKSSNYKYSDLSRENETTPLKNYDSKGIEGTLLDIQTLDWVLPETRLLLEKQFRSEMDGSKKCTKFHKDCLCSHKQPEEIKVKVKRVKSVPRRLAEPSPAPVPQRKPTPKIETFSDDEVCVDLSFFQHTQTYENLGPIPETKADFEI
jgi:hypothetical protein